MVEKYFDPCMRTELLMDASRLKGLGFALIQQDDKDQIRLMQCGSHSLIPAETRYATFDLECLAIQWVINIYLRPRLTWERYKLISDVILQIMNIAGQAIYCLEGVSFENIDVLFLMCVLMIVGLCVQKFS